ncbi:MAG TPA: MliC family protein [Geminicoccus sp.]|jgi:uncharacterized protein|uniref:MliC family protein n=1 Tax=Geminicoccus sp. TaxID=2024832 RepID=UPI002E2F9A13|nr:MliC family protein [Geminicoccus sp.]HEX2529298.1 MliC family protein [Geminicoccus sp.]
MRLHIRLNLLGTCCLLVLGASAAMAADNPLDCAAPDGPIENLICSEQALLAADVELQATYAAALAKVKDDPTESEWLQRNQQRWVVEARDGCAVEEETRACVASMYADRLSELQTAYALVQTRAPMTFRCDDDPSLPLTATIYETQPLTVRLERDGAMLEAYEVPTESGMRFEAEDVLFASDGEEAQILWIASELHCKAEPAG